MGDSDRGYRRLYCEPAMSGTDWWQFTEIERQIRTRGGYVEDIVWVSAEKRYKVTYSVVDWAGVQIAADRLYSALRFVLHHANKVVSCEILPPADEIPSNTIAVLDSGKRSNL